MVREESSLFLDSFFLRISVDLVLINLSAKKKPVRLSRVPLRFLLLCFSAVDDPVDHGSENETKSKKGCQSGNERGEKESPEPGSQDHEGSENGGEEDDFANALHIPVISLFSPRVNLFLWGGNIFF